MEALVVVESPAKAKTIEKYLGKGYTVMASKGHVVDLPKSGLGVDVEKDFEAEYIVSGPRSEETIGKLKKALKGKDKLIIAVDPDREGEAIGWHVSNQLGVVDFGGRLKKKSMPVERIVFTEITQEAVQEALKKPRSLDKDLFQAQQTRRILDRLVGYKLSPLLWKKIRFGLSAGRVQSVAVKFVVDRENERNAFKPEEYWRIWAILDIKSSVKKPKKLLVASEDKAPELEKGQIKFELMKIDGKNVEIDKQKLAEDVIEKLLSEEWKIAELTSKLSNRNPKPPFTTSTLQQTAAGWLGFNAKKTMSVAQKLYEHGHITYMRTDSTNMAHSAVEQARGYISKTYGEKFLPAEAKHYKTKAKVAQEAHESIRPSKFTSTPDDLKLDKDEHRLYQLIWQRALGSQMASAEVENIAAIIRHEVKGKAYEFRANGQKVKFKGYLEVYPEKVSEVELPNLTQGQKLDLDNLVGTQHFTEPPARFSEASLIKELEKNGIGRPSTYAPIITTIQQRGYVEKVNGYFIPTDTGIVVTNLLSEHFEEIVDKDFTAEMEDDLDMIANGEMEWVKFLHQFYDPFAKKLATKDKQITRDDFTVLGDAPKNIKCPDCGGKMILKLGKNGRFYSCEKFPDCKGILSIDGLSAEDVEKEASSEEFKKTYLPAPKTEDGRDYVLKTGRFGKFWAHPDYPKVKDAQALVFTPAKLKEMYGKTPKTESGKDFVFRRGKFGDFWAHPDYPKVKKTIRAKRIDQVAEVAVKKESE